MLNPMHAALAAATTAAAMLVAPAFAAPADQPGRALDPPTQNPAYQVIQERPDRLIVALPNRLVIAAQRVPLQPVVSVQAWIKTGSIYEQEHTGAGLSHFLEHLISGGTTVTTPEADSNAVLNRIGAQTNAATSLDTVRYYINTTADHTDDAIERMSDWMQDAVIPQAEYDRERDVIQREFDMGKGDPARIFWKLTQQARFSAHPARHPIIGYLDEFMTVSRDEIADFYERMYPPNNMLFVVTGDIDPQRAVDKVAGLWADVEPRPLPELSLPIEPEPTEPVLVTGSADVQRPRFRIAFPGVKLQSEHDYALDALAGVLGFGQSSRLVQDLRDQRGWVTSVDAFNWSAAWGEGFFGVDAELADFTPPEDIEAPTVAEARRLAVQRVIHEHLERVKAEPVTAAEMARVKRLVKSRVAQAGQSASGVAGSLARDILSTRDPDHSLRYLAGIEALTPADLTRAAEAVLDFDQEITVVLTPLEGDASVTAMVRADAVDPASLPAEPVDLDNAKLIEGLRANVAATQAEQAMELAVEEPVRFTLDNGLRVILQRSSVVPAVSIDLYWIGGLLADEAGREGVANATAVMLTRGFAGRSNADIAAQTESLGAALSSNGGNNTASIRGNALTEDLDTMLGLVADAALRPDFPEDEWARVQPRLVAGIEARNDRWSTQVGDFFRAAYYDGTTWQAPSIGDAGAVADLTAADLADFHARTLDPRHAVLAVVGDIDPDQVREMVAQRFGGLTGQASPGVAPSPEHHAGRLITHRISKPLAAVVIGLGPGITRDDPDYVPLQVLSNVLSAFPSGLLQQALRGEGPGLVYASGGYMTTGLRQGNYNILFNTAPHQVPLAIERVADVLERVKQGDFTDEQLTGAKARLLNDELAGKQSNAARATNLALDELYHVSDSGGQALLDKVTAVTRADLVRVAEAHFNHPVVVAMSMEPLDEAAIRKTLGLDREDAGTDASSPSAEPASNTPGHGMQPLGD